MSFPLKLGTILGDGYRCKIVREIIEEICQDSSVCLEARMKTPQHDPFTRDLANGLMLILAFLAFHVYIYLARIYPAVYWYDAHIRIALRHQILLGRWLPLLQLVVFTVSKFSTDLIVLRDCLAGIAALTLVGMYLLVRTVFDPVTGLIAAGLLATNLIFTALATVPYPEVLFIGLVLMALYLLEGSSNPRSRALGMLALNLACLTRYEGWLLAAVIVVEPAIRNLGNAPWKKLFVQTVTTAAMASFAPMGWLIFGVDLPQGLLARLRAVIGFEQVLKPANPLLAVIDPGQLRDFAASFFHLLSWQAGLPILLAGAAGWLIALWKTPRRALHMQVLVFVALDWCLIAFWRPWALDNLRQAFVVQVFLLLYAAHGVVEFVRIPANWLLSYSEKSFLLSWQSRAAGVLALAIALNAVPKSVAFIVDSSREPDFAVPQQAGVWLAAHLQPDDAIWILSDDVFPAYAIATYTSRPFDTILDHRLDLKSIESAVRSANHVYILELFKTRSALSANDASLLSELETGDIPARAFSVANMKIWVASGSQMWTLSQLDEQRIPALDSGFNSIPTGRLSSKAMLGGLHHSYSCMSYRN